MPEPWYYQRLGEDHGPFSDEEMQDLARAGKISPDTNVRRGKLTNWRPAFQILGLLDNKKKAKSKSDSIQNKKVPGEVGQEKSAAKDKAARRKQMVRAAMDAADRLEATGGLAESYSEIENVYRVGKKMFVYDNPKFPKTCMRTAEPVTRLRNVQVQQHEHTGSSVNITTRKARLPIGDTFINKHRETKTKWLDRSARVAEPMKIVSLISFFLCLGYIGIVMGFTDESKRSEILKRRKAWENSKARLGPDWASNQQIKKPDLGTLPWIRVEFAIAGVVGSLFCYGLAFLIARFDGITTTKDPFLIPGTFRHDGSIVIGGAHKDFLCQLPGLPKELQ